MIENLVANHLHHLKRLQRGHRVDQHVAMDADKMLAIQNTVFILAGCVDNFCREVLSLVANLLAERIFNCRIVALDEVSVDIAYCQRRFALAGMLVSLSSFRLMRDEKCEGK